MMTNGQRILITGANGGIGIAICEDLLRNNSNLVLFYHKNREEIDELIKKNPNWRELIESYQVDLLNENDMKNSLSIVLSKGTIDCFIHSVSIPLEMKSITNLNWSHFQKNIEIQTKSFLRIVQSILPSMKAKKKGKIISIISTAVIDKPPSNMSDYVVGKYSLLGLSKALAVELDRFGITVNCISPSMTNTKLIQNLPKNMIEISKNQVPSGRLTEPHDVSQVVNFLCSNDADRISGENIIISGGQTIN